jgi:hypothetical protein
MSSPSFSEQSGLTSGQHAPRNDRPTFGFLVQASTGPSGFQDMVWQGIVDAARARDVNAIVLAGGWIGQAQDDPYNESRNIVYDLCAGERLDGLAIDWSIGSYITPAGFRAFCDRFAPLPIVSLFGEIEGCPRIRADNRSGLRDVIVHLVRDHHFSRGSPRRRGALRGLCRNAQGMRHRVRSGSCLLWKFSRTFGRPGGGGAVSGAEEGRPGDRRLQ